MISTGNTQVVARDAESIYRSVCQACHMPAGEEAQGAGAYPALANNTRLIRFPSWCAGSAPCRRSAR